MFHIYVHGLSTSWHGCCLYNGETNFGNSRGITVVTSISAINTDNSVINQSVGLTNRVASAIKSASSQTGVDFSYLLNKASQESSFDPNAKASTSSATGLFQFIEQTWLRVVKVYGAKYGLDQVADRISIDNNGVARVDNSQTKYAILNLRKDPEVSAKMAAELANENREKLEKSVGGKIGSTELYLAHFLGSGGASTFIRGMRENAGAKAADVLPTAASANASVFYDKSGEARTLGQIYNYFAKKFDNNHAAEITGTVQMASVKGAKSNSKYDLNSIYASLPTTTSSAFIDLEPKVDSSTGTAYSSSALNRISNSMTNSYFATMVLSQMNADGVNNMASVKDKSFGYEDKGRQASISGLDKLI